MIGKESWNVYLEDKSSGYQAEDEEPEPDEWFQSKLLRPDSSIAVHIAINRHDLIVFITAFFLFYGKHN